VQQHQPGQRRQPGGPEHSGRGPPRSVGGVAAEHRDQRHREQRRGENVAQPPGRLPGDQRQDRRGRRDQPAVGGLLAQPSRAASSAATTVPATGPGRSQASAAPAPPPNAIPAIVTAVGGTSAATRIRRTGASRSAYQDLKLYRPPAAADAEMFMAISLLAGGPGGIGADTQPGCLSYS